MNHSTDHLISVLMKKKSLIISIWTLVFLSASFLPIGRSETPAQAPSFREDVDWLNTLQPIRLQDLHNHFVLLYFWTSSNLSCQHLLEDIHKLQLQYFPRVIIIGIHSAKFPAEKETRALQDTILRLAIDHPVVNDSQMKIWRDYGINVWPTVVLIDPNGQIIYQKEGEGVYQELNEVIAKRLKIYKTFLQTHHPIQFVSETKIPVKSCLRFPREVLADVDDERLFISDTGNQRVLITDLAGNIIEQIGSGGKGHEDGSFAQARLSGPQGLAREGNFLYIADTSNHLIRRADLTQKIVETYAGTGKMGQDRKASGTALSVDLNSPTDLAVVNDRLFVSMTGLHQIWSVDLTTQQVSIFAGSGLEGLRDGELLNGEFSQPCGLSTDGISLFVTDSGTSAVRRIGLSPEATIETIVGRGAFDFGDIDGAAPVSRLQYPLSISSTGSLLAVTDTFNNKIKWIDPVAKSSRNLAGSGRPGTDDAILTAARFNEPSSISYADNKLYVADTNNHVIRIVDLTDKKVKTLPVVCQTQGQESRDAWDPSNAERIPFTTTLSSYVYRVFLNVKFTKPYMYLKGSPSVISIRTPEGELIRSFPIDRPNITFLLKKVLPYEKVFAQITVYFYDLNNESLSLKKDILFEIPLTSSREKEDLRLSVEIQPNENPETDKE